MHQTCRTFLSVTGGTGGGGILREERECRSSGQAKKEKRNSSVPARYLCHEITQETQRSCFRLLLAMRGKANSTSIFTHLEEFLAVLFKRLEYVCNGARLERISNETAGTRQRLTTRALQYEWNKNICPPDFLFRKRLAVEFSDDSRFGRRIINTASSRLTPVDSRDSLPSNRQ